MRCMSPFQGHRLSGHAADAGAPRRHRLASRMVGSTHPARWKRPGRIRAVSHHLRGRTCRRWPPISRPLRRGQVGQSQAIGTIRTAGQAPRTTQRRRRGGRQGTARDSPDANARTSADCCVTRTPPCNAGRVDYPPSSSVRRSPGSGSVRQPHRPAGDDSYGQPAITNPAGWVIWKTRRLLAGGNDAESQRMHAVTLTEFGGPEVMRWTQVPDLRPGPGQVLIDVAAAGVNRADLFQRQGFYPPPPGASDVLGLDARGSSPKSMRR